MKDMTTLTQTWQQDRSLESPVRSRAKTAVLWTLQGISAAMFLLAGGLKLAGIPVEVQLFAAIGIGQWFRYVTGTIEVVGAVMLLVPSLAIYGAVPLAVTMVGALLTHFFIIGGNFAAALLLLVSTTTIAWMRRSER
jgi:putative oxidoreductase